MSFHSPACITIKIATPKKFLALNLLVFNRGRSRSWIYGKFDPITFKMNIRCAWKRTRAILILLLLVVFAEQSLSKCADEDRKEITQDVKRYSANLSTVMLHHELSWAAADTNATVAYSVEVRFLRNYLSTCTKWFSLKHCQNITKRTCDIDESNSHFEFPVDVEFRITGRINDSNQTVYVTEPIYFNRHKNLTLNAPSMYLSANSSEEVVIYLAVSEVNWKGLTDTRLKSLKYEIQYWNGGESDPTIHNTTASKLTSEMIILKEKKSWICGRARLYVNVDVVSGEDRDVYSPWSEVNCTDPEEQPTHFNVIVPALAIISVVVIILIALCIWNIWGGTCKDLFKKAPLPDAVVKIIFSDETADAESNKAKTDVTEEFEAIDCENNNQSWSITHSPDPTLALIEDSVECQSTTPSVIQIEDPIPLHHSNDLTYGIGYPQDQSRDCFTAENAHDGFDIENRHYPSSADKFFRYRNYLSSTSTTSTELSPAIIEERSQEYRFEDHDDGSTSENTQMPHGSMPKRNVFFRRSSFTERIHEFDGFNIAYSSNPLRDVPDLLCVDTVLVNE